MASIETPLVVNPTKRIIAYVILLVIAMVLFSVINWYFTALVTPLVDPLIAVAYLSTFLIAFKQMRTDGFALAAKAMDVVREAADSTAGEIQELRKELQRLTSPDQFPKAAGFQISPETTPGAGDKR